SLHDALPICLGCLGGPSSVLSLAFACPLVCHCMFPGVSEPPLASGVTWSTTWPGRPCGYPVRLMNSRLADSLRLILPWESRATPDTARLLRWRVTEWIR